MADLWDAAYTPFAPAPAPAPTTQSEPDADPIMDDDPFDLSLGEDGLDGVKEGGGDVPVEFITGQAGTGKTYLIKQRIEEDPDYAVLTSSTGIAAVNLGGTTINSLLGYYDTESLRDLYIRGGLQAKLRTLANKGIRRIVLDECSMVDKEQLGLLYQALKDTNALKTVKQPIGLTLVGDFCQLPPVKADWCFKADCWEKFAAHTTRLTKVWRQSNPDFLSAINALRSGKGKEAADLLEGQVRFEWSVNQYFEGTTIMGRNDEVDRFNFTRLSRLTGKPVGVISRRWGKQSGEWKKNIPEQLELKIGALVMILSNDSPAFTYVNGDTGTVEEFDGRNFHIKLARNGNVVPISPIHRTVIQREPPEGIPQEEWLEASGRIIPFGKVSFDEDKGVWHVGGVVYYPLRLAWASTVHKTQGLTLDNVQVDVRNQFMAQPAMCYVALSRGRTPEGMRIVGSPEKLISHCNVHPEVVPWL